MALPITFPPVLRGKSAQRMRDAIEAAEQNRGSVEFSVQIEQAKQILERSRAYLDGTEIPPINHGDK